MEQVACWESAGGRLHIRDYEAVFCHLDLSLNFLVNNDKTPGLGNEIVSFLFPSWKAREARAALSACVQCVCLYVQVSVLKWCGILPSD